MLVIGAPARHRPLRCASSTGAIPYILRSVGNGGLRQCSLKLLHGVQWIDAAIARKSGPAHNAILGIGHVMEIVRRLREFGDLPTASAVQDHRLPCCSLSCC